jgi:hypothetical protein
MATMGRIVLMGVIPFRTSVTVGNAINAAWADSVKMFCLTGAYGTMSVVHSPLVKSDSGEERAFRFAELVLSFAAHRKGFDLPESDGSSRRVMPYK